MHWEYGMDEFRGNLQQQCSVSGTPVSKSIREFIFNLFLKITTESLLSAFSRSHTMFLWISLEKWEKGGNLILTLIGLLFGSNNRKTYNYPIDNYSLHTSPQSQKMALSSRTAATEQGAHM